MLHLELLAYLSNRHAIAARTNIDHEKSVILFRRQFCPRDDHLLTETKKLPHRMSEGTERSVVLCLERSNHRRGFWHSFPCRTKSLGTKRDFLKVRRVTRSLSQRRQIIRCSHLKGLWEFDLPSVNHTPCERHCCRCCTGKNLS